MFKIIFIVTSLVAFSLCDIENYCNVDETKCTKGEHIGCGSEFEFDRDSKKCQKWSNGNAELIELGKDEIDEIVHQHNVYRNATAFGEAIDGVTASRLCTLQWDEELALTACFNVWACFDDHDGCRNTEKFDHAGQNLYNSYSYNEFNVKDALLKPISKWYEERTQFQSTSIIDVFPRNNYASVGHFTQMMKDNVCFVGCCAAKWDDGNGKIFQYWVCNYSYCNMIDNPVFKRGKTASECKTGTHKDYNGLCSLDEEWDMKVAAKDVSKLLYKGKKGPKIVKTGGGRGHRSYHHTYHF